MSSRRGIVARAIVASLAIAASGCSGDAGTRPAFTILTFNILHGIGNEDPAAEPFDRFPERLPWIAAELARRRPDVVLLQETLSGAPGDYPDVVGTLLGELNREKAGEYVAVFGNIFGGPARENEGAGVGQTTLARLPVLAKENHAVVAVKPFSPRTVLHVRVSTRLGEIDVYNAHLQGPEDPALAATEMEDALAFVDSTVGPEATAILAGDLNSPEGAPVYQVLRDAGFVDLAALAGLECSERTNRGCTNETFPLGEAGNRTAIKLDYVWLRSPRTFRSLCDPAFNSPVRLADGGFLWPSDHIGVAASLGGTRGAAPPR